MPADLLTNTGNGADATATLYGAVGSPRLVRGTVVVGYDADPSQKGYVVINDQGNRSWRWPVIHGGFGWHPLKIYFTSGTLTITLTNGGVGITGYINFIPEEG